MNPDECDDVLDLHRNFISLGTLDSKGGCKCTAAGGVMRVARGAMVIMKGELLKGLYRLAVTGGGGVAPRKKGKSVQVEVDGKNRRCCNKHFQAGI